MGSPSRSSAINATVTIDVYRNLFHPYFTGEPFTTSITENIIANTSILQVNVGDDDTEVSHKSNFVPAGFLQICMICFLF